MCTSELSKKGIIILQCIVLYHILLILGTKITALWKNFKNNHQIYLSVITNTFSALMLSVFYSNKLLNYDKPPFTFQKGEIKSLQGKCPRPLEVSTTQWTGTAGPICSPSDTGAAVQKLFFTVNRTWVTVSTRNIWCCTADHSRIWF